MEPWARLVKLRKMSSKFRKCSFPVHCSKLLLRMHVVEFCFHGNRDDDVIGVRYIESIVPRSGRGGLFHY